MTEPPDRGGSVASLVGSSLAELECTACGASVDADKLHGLCPACGKVLFARYDLEGVRRSMPAPDFSGRTWDLWRYRELLPIRDERRSEERRVGEGGRCGWARR